MTTLLIHVPRITNRVGYTLNAVFKHFLRLDFEMTTDIGVFERFGGAKIAYGEQKVGDGLFVRSCGLLFQTSIEEQMPRCFRHDGNVALFPVFGNNPDWPYDIFAAVFYCLSRYEEYLPFRADAHGRFPATESLAYKEGFLRKAVVDRWAISIGEKLKERYPEMHVPPRHFDFEDTFDIDAAYCYKHKGLFRTMVGLGRDLFSHRQPDEVRKRMRVLLRKCQDPFDTFDYILDVHRQYPWMRLKFFPLMADYNVFDKPISYITGEFRELLQHLCDYAKMGLHASYASYEDPSKIAVESERLSAILHRRTLRNRFHFLKMSLPQSYEKLLDNGIVHDYSMGYADEPGLRAGTCTPYPFFDLESDCETALTVHPFAVMDSTLYFYKKMTTEESEKVYRELIDEMVEVEGIFCALWHNQSLCEDFGWQGWRSVYEGALGYAAECRLRVASAPATDVEPTGDASAAVSGQQ